MTMSTSQSQCQQRADRVLAVEKISVLNKLISLSMLLSRPRCPNPCVTTHVTRRSCSALAGTFTTHHVAVLQLTDCSAACRLAPCCLCNTNIQCANPSDWQCLPRHGTFETTKSTALQCLKHRSCRCWAFFHVSVHMTSTAHCMCH